MSRKSKNNSNASGILLLLHTLKRVLTGDRNYINRVSAYKDDADYLEIKHNGNVDYGEIVYVIKENCDHDGFCSALRFIMCNLIFAEQHGLAPKIVLTNSYAYYDAKKSKEISNPWEYYFIQAEGDIDENNALNVCYGNYYQMQMIRERYDINAYKIENYYNEEIFRICSPIIRKYIVFKPEITSQATEMLRKVREDGRKVLGVHYRGTDFKSGYNGHPVCIDEEQLIAEMSKAIKDGGFTSVFVATDDIAICDRIKTSFKDTEVLMFPDVYRSSGDKSVAFSEDERKFHHYLLGYEIARDMYTLSLCDGLLAGKSQVSFMSNLFKHSRNDEYEFMHIIDNGNYSSDKPFVARPE